MYGTSLRKTQLTRPPLVRGSSGIPSSVMSRGVFSPSTAYVEPPSCAVANATYSNSVLGHQAEEGPECNHANAGSAH